MRTKTKIVRKVSACPAGLTLIEILVVLAIMGLLAVLAVNSFGNFSTVQALQAGSGNAASLIARAQSESVAGTGGAPHGVHIASTTLTLFTGSSFATGTVSQILVLTGTVAVVQTNLAGGGADVVFDQITGATEEPGNIVLQVGGNTAYSKTITISATGVVSVQ